MKLFFKNLLEATKTPIKRLWISGDAHSYSDATRSTGTVEDPYYEPIKTAVQHMIDHFGVSGIDGGINVGDFSGKQGDPEDDPTDDGEAHTNQLQDPDIAAVWDKIRLFPGNHDKYPANWWDTYVGEDNMPADYPYFVEQQHGNISLIGFGDVNRMEWPAGKGDGSETGGFPAASSKLSAWAKGIYQVLSHPDKMFIFSAHENPRNTTTNTFDYAEGAPEHRKQQHGSPVGRGRWQFMINDALDAIYEAQPYHERFFPTAPDNLLMMLGGHTHRAIRGWYEVNSLRGIFQKQRHEYPDGPLVMNIASLSEFHGSSSIWGDSKSWVAEIYMQSMEFRCFVHRSDNTQGLQAGDEFIPIRKQIQFPFAFQETYEGTDPSTPSGQVSGVSFSNVDERKLDCSYTKSDDGTLVVRSASSFTWTPTDDTPYYAGQEVESGVVIAYIGPNESFHDFDLDAGTSYTYKFFTYNAGNGSMLYNASPITDSQSTLAFTALPSSLSSLGLALDGKDKSSVTFADPTSSRISTWSNQGSLGGNFVATEFIREANFNMEGVRSNGNSAMLFDQTVVVDTITAFDLFVCHRSPRSNLNNNTLIDIGNSIQIIKTNNANAQARNSSGMNTLPTDNPYLDWGIENDFIVEHLRLDGGSGDLILFENNTEIGRISSFGSITSGNDTIMLFSSVGDAFTRCHCGQILGLFADFGSNVDRNTIYNAITSRYL